MENAINYVALFYKVGSSIRDFSRKEKFKILVKRDITLKLLIEEVRKVMFLFIFQFKHDAMWF